MDTPELAPTVDAGSGLTPEQRGSLEADETKRRRAWVPLLVGNMLAGSVAAVNIKSDAHLLTGVAILLVGTAWSLALRRRIRPLTLPKSG